LTAADSITELLQDWKAGDSSAIERVTALVYQDLRRLAAHHLKHERIGHTLDATALVHEVYLRIHGRQDVDWETRAHFLAVVTNLMRGILVDHARRRLARKRTFPDELRRRGELRYDANDLDLVEIHMALEKLTDHFPRPGRVVELRFFGGLDTAETAAVLGISTASVERDWRFARVWLRDEITRSA
jgi:RNA polymerase sigma-70 factor, ECF subfamily